MQILSVFRLFYLLGAANALFFSLLIFSKKSKTVADKILGVWLIILFAQLFLPFLYLTNLDIYYQYAGYEISFYVFHPFLLYLYVKTTVSKLLGWKVFFWNSLIIIISELFGLTFLLFPPEERLMFIEGKIFLPLFYIPLVVLLIVYFTYNIYASYKILKDYKNDVLQVYSYRENIELLWLRRLVVLFGLISLLVFPLGIISYYIFHSIVFADYFFFVTLAVFVFLLGYWGYQQGQIFNINNEIEISDTKETDKTVIISEQSQNQFKSEAEELKVLMENSKPFLEPTLAIHDLARMTNMPPHLLSKVINKEFHCNFFEFINTYRVNEFKKKIEIGEFKDLTILAVALECGFSSKSAFNRIFKEYTGLTPSAFINQNKTKKTVPLN